jgi:hypothetical protein
MCDFHVGQEVVCVNKCVPSRFNEVMPDVGSHYHVREIEAFPLQNGVGIRLVGIRNPVHLYRYGREECAFSINDFRPVKKESIAIFRAMCVSPKPLVPVD